MCVICTAPIGHLPTKTELAAMAAANPDGMGYALRTPEGEFYSAKSDWSTPLLDEIESERDFFKASDVLLHFRLATHGAVCADNCQPIALSGSEFFAHNGIAWDYTYGVHACDSFNLADAWAETRDTRIFERNAVGVASLDNDGLHWIHGGILLGSDRAIGVSNLYWQHNM